MTEHAPDDKKRGGLCDGSTSTSLALTWSCGFYLCSSAGMSIFNKLAITALPLPTTLVMIQMSFTVCTTLVGWRAVHIGSMRDALRWGCTVPILFSAMLVSSMFAMRHNTLGTLAVFRNIAPLITLAIERLFRVPIQVSRMTISALLTIVAGVVIYYYDTLQLSWFGFMAICLNMAFAVLERLLQRYLLAHDPVDISKPGMMLLNNGCGLLPNVLLVLLYNEPAQWSQVFGEMSSAGWGVVALSCLNGVAISYAGLRVQQLVTATTFMVLTNVNKFIVIMFGVVALREALSPISCIGVLMAIGGGLMYARARQQLTVTPPPPPKEEELSELLVKRDPSEAPDIGRPSSTAAPILDRCPHHLRQTDCGQYTEVEAAADMCEILRDQGWTRSAYALARAAWFQLHTAADST
eukprot:CAMPEP_0183337796 /NCGR_PEP_ID=MMETSP0164_2-20130417/5315_1 /TAXON_ID=221442 /ORGANISM="Coccolithus pelagicus ssp braarudi, Strain PLY182g" /LENGTH=408 /DNA_ID=CAMNT_0025507543 /DNA_START=83 /DNA_END=1311 /DNA_ORIENTATION=-